MNAADYPETARPYLERIQPYAQRPDAFRTRWRLSHFRFRWSSWLAAALLLALVAAIAWKFGDVHLALKGVLAVMALIAVLPLARDFRRTQCVLCDEQPERLSVRTLSGEDHVVTACHHCRVVKVERADSHPVTL
jgi:hypothetical protein